MHMPRQFIVESDIPLEAQCDGLPINLFPKKRGTTFWDLPNDPGDLYKVKAEGFPIIPYSTSTIDNITGKEVDKANLDSGDWRDSTPCYIAMKFYIGWSRVKTANDILLTGMISPALFTNSCFPWPNRLMQHLHQAGNELKADEHVGIDRMYTKNYLFKDKTWWCSSCKTNHLSKNFTTTTLNEDDPCQWLEDFDISIMQPGPFRECRHESLSDRRTFSQCRRLFGVENFLNLTEDTQKAPGHNMLKM